MPDKERVIELLSTYGVPERYLHDLYDEIEECFAPVIEDAEKWEKVEEIANPRHLIACADCPVTKQCRNGAEGLCSSVYKLVAALSEVPHE